VCLSHHHKDQIVVDEGQDSVDGMAPLEVQPVSKTNSFWDGSFGCSDCELLGWLLPKGSAFAMAPLDVQPVSKQTNGSNYVDSPLWHLQGIYGMLGYERQCLVVKRIMQVTFTHKDRLHHK
jgi:hypothetical protein